MPQPATATKLNAEIFAAFNRFCRCELIDEARLAQELDRALPESSRYSALHQSRPHLFSPIAVFVPPEDTRCMRAIIGAVEQVIATRAYREAVLMQKDAVIELDPGSPGVFFGYDFHLSAAGPKLIEINTNAGGALLNTALARATRECCPEINPMTVGSANPNQLENIFIEMFRREWRAQRGDAPLRTVAIVDDEPTAQYLYPEFELFETLFTQTGWRTVIADAASLQFRDGRLYAGTLPIDLVYNRLTDFALSDPRHIALREAYLQRRVVVTPHPRAYALYADKRNLVLFTNNEFLGSLALPDGTITTLLNGIPRTLAVTREKASVFWTERKQWFFKPTTGFGGRGAYRGDKLTKRTFEEILKGGYVAQQRVDPAERAHLDTDESPFKFDVRCYVYAGEIQLIAARLYHGQTTNFRTPGGGFAPVFYSD